MSKKPIINKITGTSPLDIKRINDNFEEVSKKMNTDGSGDLSELRVGCSCGLGAIEQYDGDPVRYLNTDIYLEDGVCLVTKQNFSSPIILEYKTTFNGKTGYHIILEPNLLYETDGKKSPIYRKTLRIISKNLYENLKDEIVAYIWKFNEELTELVEEYRINCKNKHEYWIMYKDYNDGYHYCFEEIMDKVIGDVYSTVATTGSYNDLLDKPVYKKVATTGSYNDLLNKPTLAKVATSANYHDLNKKIRSINITANKNYMEYYDGKTTVMSDSTDKAVSVHFTIPYRETITGSYSGIYIRSVRTFKNLDESFIGYLGDDFVAGTDIKCLRIMKNSSESFSEDVINALEQAGSNFIRMYENKEIYLFVAFGNDNTNVRLLESYGDNEVTISFAYDEFLDLVYTSKDEMLYKTVLSNITSTHTPTASEIGALPISGNTKATPITNDVYFANGKGLYGLDADGNIVRLAVSKDGTNYFGVQTYPTLIRSSNNPSVMVGDNTYTMYHSGNVPRAIWSAGDKTAETGTNAPVAGHMAMNTIYNNGYPCTFGNLLTLSGAGKAELAMEWTGNDTPTTGRLYYRSKRDTGGVAWGGWKKIAYSDDVPNKSYTSMALEYCARSADTGNSNTNKYFKLATYTIDANYGSVSAEYSVGFNGHGMSTSPHHKIGVWVKRQDSNFHMDLKVWGATNDNYATYILVQTGTYQATLYAFLRTQYCTLYMSCLSRFYNSATIQYYTGATPIDTVGSTNVYGTYMDKPSVTGGVECIFDGKIAGSSLSSSNRNTYSCVNSSGYFTVPSTGLYMISGQIIGTDSIIMSNDSNSYTLLYNYGCTINSKTALCFNRTLYLTKGNVYKFKDAYNVVISTIYLTILRLN